ncbi:MAG: hypothetical protein H7838_04515 [Magnetococcus sp. DMHC-8]
MRRWRHVPLFIYLLFVYNMVVFANEVVSGFTLSTVLYTFTMLSGPVLTINVGESLLMVGVIALYVEILKTTQGGAVTTWDHLFAMVTFAGFLVEFLLVARAATAIFFTLMLMALMAVVAGYTASMTTVRREIGAMEGT